MSAEIPWEGEVDVAVVGFGAAGACAALQAREAGASVAILDRFMGGGATAISGGIVYAGGGTHIQEQAGVQDTVDEMVAYLQQEVQDVIAHSTLRDFCEKSADNLHWLEHHGVVFGATLCPYKTSYPLDRYCLYYSGNETALPYRERATPAPRGHRVKGKGMPGRRLFEPLRRSAHRHNALVYYQSQVERLLCDASGALTGVEFRQLPPGSLAALAHRWCEKLAQKINNYSPRLGKRLRERASRLEKKHARPHFLRVLKGVVLSTGGFIYNRAMVQQHAPDYRPGMPLGTAGCDGSGIELGQSVKGATRHLNRVSAWRFINPPRAFTQGVLLNSQGERYVNEELYGATIGEEMVERQGGTAILIIDATLRKKARAQVGWRKTQWFQTAPTLLNLWFNARRADSIEGLARLCRMPEDALRQTLEAYNQNATSGADDPFGKSAEGHHVLTPPFFAINCSITSKRFPCPTLTLGGLVVDETTGQVQGASGQPVPGLYAAGRAAVGVCSRQYVSGLSIADCVYSGRRAGHAASQAEASSASNTVQVA